MPLSSRILRLGCKQITKPTARVVAAPRTAAAAARSEPTDGRSPKSIDRAVQKICSCLANSQAFLLVTKGFLGNRRTLKRLLGNFVIPLLLIG